MTDESSTPEQRKPNYPDSEGEATGAQTARPGQPTSHPPGRNQPDDEAVGQGRDKLEQAGGGH